MPTTNDLAAPAATARASNSLLLSKGVAEAYYASRETLGFPMTA